MATGTYSPDPFVQFEDANGNPLGSGKLFTYIAGTATPQATFSDINLTVQNANPILLDSTGRNPAGAIFLTPGQSYKYILQDLNGNTILTRDNISAVPPSSANFDVTGTVGQGITAGQVVYLSAGDGGKIAGQWYLADTGNAYSSVTKWVGIAPNAISSGQTGTIRIEGYVTGLSALTVGATYYVGANGALVQSPAQNARIVGQADTATSLVMSPDPPLSNQVITNPTLLSPGINTQISSGSALLAHICQGRLTLVSATPVTTADVTGATGIYFTPYAGNNIALFDGIGTWTLLPFSETILSLGTLTNNLTYDVFGFNNGGVLALELLAWASTSARATGLVLQNGVLCKSGATTRRLLGSFTTTSTTTTEDSQAKRHLSNYYNRQRRPLFKTETATSWNYSVAAWHQTNANTANQVEITCCFAEMTLELTVCSVAINNTAGVQLTVGIGEDTTTQNTLASNGTGFTFLTGLATNLAGTGFGWATKNPTIGKHVYAWLEFSSATGITTFQGPSLYNGPGIAGWWES